tara:strand:- start:586 stop:2376 length:1791 start_codon:yes stop_codon:yes gene_type:complete
MSSDESRVLIDRERQEIHIAICTSKRFSGAKKVGEGSYGIVFKCLDNTNGTAVAVKVFKLAFDETGINQSIVREVNCQRGIRDARFACMSEFIVTDKMFMMITEGMKHGLSTDIKQRGRYTAQRARGAIKQIEQGVSYLHCTGIVHRDLKADNCVTGPEGRVKIIDMGTARCLIPGRTYTPDCTTLWYRSPEMLMGSVTYTKATDDWCVGCILVHMLEGVPPFTGSNNWEVWMAILKRTGTPDAAQWERLLFHLPGIVEYDAVPKFKAPSVATRAGGGEGVDVCTGSSFRTGDAQPLPSAARAWLSLDPSERRAAAVDVERIPCVNLLSTRRDKDGQTQSWCELHVQLTDSMRGILVDWLLQVAVKMNVEGEVIHVMVALLDARVGRLPVVERSRLQLVGMACLLVACKLTECVTIQDIEHVCDSTYTSDEIRQAEKELFEHAAFMDMRTTYEAHLHLFSAPPPVLKASRSLCRLALMQYRPPFDTITVAATAIRMAGMYFTPASDVTMRQGDQVADATEADCECLAWMHSLYANASDGWKSDCAHLWGDKEVPAPQEDRTVSCLSAAAAPTRKKCPRPRSSIVKALGGRRAAGGV